MKQNILLVVLGHRGYLDTYGLPRPPPSESAYVIKECKTGHFFLLPKSSRHLRSNRTIYQRKYHDYDRVDIPSLQRYTKKRPYVAESPEKTVNTVRVVVNIQSIFDLTDPCQTYLRKHGSVLVRWTPRHKALPP